MKADVLATVTALIEVAADERTNVDEARNAALQACRLIKKHGLLAAPTTRPTAQGFYRPSARVEIPFEEFFDELFGNVTVRRARRQEPEPPAAPPPEPKPQARERRVDANDPDKKTVPIVDNPAYCGLCGQRILRGKFAVWSHSRFYHQTCWDQEAEA